MHSLYLPQLKEKTPLELFEDAIRLMENNTPLLSKQISSGALHAYFNEWRLCLQRFALQFAPKRRDTPCQAQMIRLVRTCDAGAPLSELESLQLAEDRFHIDRQTHTLNIQLGHARTSERPYYRVGLNALFGFTVDRIHDFKPRQLSAASSSLATVLGSFMEKAYALACLPPDINATTLRRHLAPLADYRAAYYRHLKSLPAQPTITLYEVALCFTAASPLMTFCCFIDSDLPLNKSINTVGDLLVIRQINGGKAVFITEKLASYRVYARTFDARGALNDNANFLEERQEIAIRHFS